MEGRRVVRQAGITATGRQSGGQGLGGRRVVRQAEARQQEVRVTNGELQTGGKGLLEDRGKGQERMLVGLILTVNNELAPADWKSPA